MMRSFLCSLAVLALVLAADPALAAGGSTKKPKGHGEKAEAVPAVPSQKMPRLVAPLIVGGQLVRYVHFDVTLMLPDDKNKKQLMDKVPYLQDAFLRDVHATTILKNEETEEIDVAGLRGRLLAICDRVVGAGSVKDVEFRDVSKDIQ
jgi:flagellar basal body-associated protein FliL